MTGKLVRDEVNGLRTRYVIDLERTADDHVEGVLRRDGLSEPVPFSGWIELLSLLEPQHGSRFGNRMRKEAAPQ